jgi:hypothetical protein
VTDGDALREKGVRAGLEEGIRSLAADGRISCRDAFSLAEAHGVGIGEVGRTLDGMGIKITACQLGCFP